MVESGNVGAIRVDSKDNAGTAGASTIGGAIEGFARDNKLSARTGIIIMFKIVDVGKTGAIRVYFIDNSLTKGAALQSNSI